MKALLLITLLFSMTASAGILNHRIKPDGLARSGRILISHENGELNQFKLNFKYRVKIKTLLYSKVFEGSDSQVLPNEFRTENGYITLEEKGTLHHPKATIKHLGRQNFGPYYDCHYVHLIPSHTDKWELKFLYCPDIPTPGFARFELIKHKIFLIGTHTFISELESANYY